MSSIITLIDALELVPERFAHGGEISAAEESIPITLSVAWSREIDMRELSKYRAMRLAAGKYKFSERTIARDFWLHESACGKNEAEYLCFGHPMRRLLLLQENQGYP